MSQYKDVIFIHIPKTGGTTINCAMNGTKWQTTPDFNYRHIIYQTKASNCADIFEPENFTQYKAHKIFGILRNPVDRLISEYYFIRDRPEFMKMLKGNPKNLQEYAKVRQTQNYMVNFLLGRKMFDLKFATEADLEKVIHAIDNLPIHMGIFEHYAESMDFLGKKLKIKWPAKMDVKRITLNRPKREAIDAETQELILKKNDLDFRLYQHCLAKLNLGTLSSKIEFKKDKYEYVLKYTQRFVLLELYLTNKKVLSRNNDFFKNLNLFLHNKMKLQTGRDYVNVWNDAFVKTLKNQVEDEKFQSRLNDLDLNKQAEPLENTLKICTFLDSESQKTIGNRLLSVKFNFDPQSINYDLIQKVKRKSFLGSLFGK